MTNCEIPAINKKSCIQYKNSTGLVKCLPDGKMVIFSKLLSLCAAHEGENMFW